MLIPYKGKQRTLTTEFIMEVGGISKDAAYRRIRKYANKKITLRQLLSNKTHPTNKEITYERDGISITNSELQKLVKGITRSSASKRLRQWVRHEISYEQMTAPLWGYTTAEAKNYGTLEWQALDDKDIQRSPYEVKITPFEREYGARKERDYGYVDAGR